MGHHKKDGEQPIVNVRKIFTDLQVGFTAEACTAIFRRGKIPNNEKVGQREKRDQRPRPIVVILPTQAEKAQILTMTLLSNKRVSKGTYAAWQLLQNQRDSTRK